jgi:hypothetical protein
VIRSYLDALALAYLAAPSASPEEGHLEEALVAACERHGVDFDEVAERVLAEQVSLLCRIDETDARQPGDPLPCPACRGTGADAAQRDAHGIDVECERCDGEGNVEDDADARADHAARDREIAAGLRGGR